MNEAATILDTAWDAQESPNRLVTVQAFGLTDPGRVRTTNEDQFLIAELTKAMHVGNTSLPLPEMQFAEQRGHLFIVADGMGGHRAGEQASALAVETIETFALNTLKWFLCLKDPEQRDVLKEFQTALQQADLNVCQQAAEHPELQGMGTTVTMAYSLGLRLFIVHVGDSRGYLFRSGGLHRLTRDHTLVAELVRQGRISPDEAAHHRLRHVITNAVGGHEPGVQVECHRIELESQDTLLLCSDGLTEMVPDDRIAAIIQAEPDPQTACQRFVTEANQRGGNDNITVIVARFEAGG